MLNNELSAEMVDHLTAGILKKYNDKLLSAVQRLFPELDIKEVQSLDDVNRNALGERAVVHAIARDKQRNKYGLIIQVGSQREGENILEIANGYQEEVIFGGLDALKMNSRLHMWYFSAVKIHLVKGNFVMNILAASMIKELERLHQHLM